MPYNSADDCHIYWGCDICGGCGEYWYSCDCDKDYSNIDYNDADNCQALILSKYGFKRHNKFTSKLYYNAYERGHSAGEYEVNMLFDSLMYDFQETTKEWAKHYDPSSLK